MLNLRKTAAAVLALGSSAVFAGTMGPVCAPGNVTVPCEMTAWDFGVQGLYLQPVSALDSTIDTRRDGDHDNDRNWQWGFKIEGSYHFSTGNDITLNWYHLTNNRHDDRFIDRFDFDPTVARDRFALRIEPRWDEANAEIGQHVDFSEHSRVRFHGGVQYSRVAHELRFGRRGSFGADPLAFRNRASIEAKSSFNGFGPRIGADLNYDFGNGLAIYANGASSLLVGTSRFGGELDFLDIERPLFSLSVRKVVPQIEGKLGLKYDYPLAQGVVGLDVGYMWVDYLNVEGLRENQHDFALHGVFFGAKWIGNV